MPEIYRSPRELKDQPDGETNYLGITAKGALMAKPAVWPYDYIRDGTSKTLLIAESRQTVPWTKPEDCNGLPEFFLRRSTPWRTAESRPTKSRMRTSSSR